MATYEYLEKIKGLFKRKGWDGELELYDRFCNRIDEWSNDEERDFFLELSEHFLWIQLEEYPEYIKYILEKVLLHAIPKKQKDVFLLPLKSINDIKHEKSGDLVAYLLHGRECINLFLEHGKKRHVLSSIVFCLNKISFNSEKIVLIDDFIGSGNTAVAVIEELLSSGKISVDRIIIAVIVIMEDAYKKLIEKGVCVICRYKERKGIHSFYTGDELQEKLCMIENMTAKVKVRNALGYNDSESLVSMYRTPNNTFPIFWAKIRKKNGEGPFSR